MESQNDSQSQNFSFKGQQFSQCLIKTHSPNLRNIQKLILEQTALSMYHHLHPTLNSAFKQTNIQLKYELRRVELSRWDSTLNGGQVTILEDRVKNILHKITKLKELNIYFGDLKKEAGMLETDVERFLFYHPQDGGLPRNLQTFMTEPTVSQLILKQYQKSFNPNYFAADIINFLDFLHQHRLISVPVQEPYTWARNRDLLLIQNTNIIFRQVCEISDKYSLVEQQLLNAYIHLDFIREEQHIDTSGQKKFRQETELIDKKMKELKIVAEKVKRKAGNYPSIVDISQTVVLAQEPDLFGEISRQFDFCLKKRNENFFSFLQELYEGKQSVQVKGQGNFNFIRLKIIKAEMRWHLNRIFSALNVGSHVATKLHDNITANPHHYTFQAPSTLIRYELNCNRISFYSDREATLEELNILCREVCVVQKEEGFILQMQGSKVVYPSALNNYYYLLKYLLCLSTILEQKDMYSEQLLLEITSIKADELMEWAQTVHNVLQMIKGKYYSCYHLLKDYVYNIFRVNWLQELEFVQREVNKGEISKLLSFYISKEKKAEWVNQIIFQLDSSFDIYQPFKKLVEIQRRHSRTLYVSDQHYFYELILNQIIQTRNNLKFDRCYSYSALHQLFGLTNARPSNIKALAKQLAPLSKSRMRLPDLLKLYSSQCRMKREVFKAELYWISIAQTSVKNKFLISNQKKKISFKDFLQENGKYLLNLGDKSLEYFLNNIEQIQRSTLLFSHQVQRLKLIQCSLLVLKPDFPLQDSLSAFSHSQLKGFFSHCTDYNFVEDLFVRRDKNNHILVNIKTLLAQDKLKFTDLNMDLNIVNLKHLLAAYIFFIYALGHHYTHEDCLQLKSNIMDRGELPELHLKLQIWRSKREIIKQFEECQFLDWQSMAELVQTYQLLIHIAFNRVVERDDLSICDKNIFKAIRNGMPLYQPFKELEQLKETQKTKHFANTVSKTHTYSCIKYIFEQYKEKRQKIRGYTSNWSIIENLFIICDIGIVSRRLFCNQLIQLKYQVASEEWKNMNRPTCLEKLRLMFDKEFVQRINQFMVEELSSIDMLNSHCNLNQNYSVLVQVCRKQIIQQYDQKFNIEEVKQRQIVLFDQQRGLQVDFKEDDSNRHYFNPKKPRQLNRQKIKGLIMQDPESVALVNALSQKVNLEIVRESLPTRKMIYQLQLKQKRVRDEIAWQTCKLQHNVINKINHFIEESNQDQKQSLINFKYTVNLQTIKGIENVIHERTEMVGKNYLEEDNFITEPKPQKSKVNEQSLLQINVRNMFSHVKKIKIFWAWKSMYMSNKCGEDQWGKFSVNAQKILYNKENIKKMNHLQHVRQTCSRQEILCKLIKQENYLYNNGIKNSKVNHLNQKLKEFQQKHGVRNTRDTIQTQCKIEVFDC